MLLCTIGATPQVVTETVSALRRQSPPWVPDEIHVVTTTFALAKIRAALQAPSGPLAKMFGRPTPPVRIHVPRSGGTPHVLEPPRAEGDWEESGSAFGRVLLPDDALTDVNTEKDAAVMGNAILRLIVGVVQDPRSELHVSLAGGRKTMSAHALMALSLVGRPRDRASHVLVDPPYEDHPDFWHPEQEGGLLMRKESLRELPRPAPSLDPAKAKLVLVQTPAPLMRYEVKHLDPLANLDLVDLVALVNIASVLEADPHVTLDTKRNTLIAGDVERRLSPKVFAAYRLLAAARAEGWPGVGPEGEGRGHRGWLSYQHISTGRTASGRPIDQEMLIFLKEAAAAAGGDAEEDRIVTEWKLGYVVETNLRRKKIMIKANLSPSFTNLETSLRKGFGSAGASFLMWTTLTRPVRFGLTLPPKRIEIA